jgi:hypothetical protein
MKPYTGYEQQPDTTITIDHGSVPVHVHGYEHEHEVGRDSYVRRIDYSNLLLIFAGWAAVQLVLPPAHEYPVIDDWIYARTVQVMHLTGQFFTHPMTQANLFGLTVWGTLWTKVFGFSFTTLTYSTLVLALAGLLAFYGIGRAVGVPPAGALLGTALFGFNPITLHLSYTFMTDVPFMSLVLVSCYLYIRGLQRGDAAWLLAGGFVAAWAYTIRQFGLLVPVAFVLYVAFDRLLRGGWPCLWRGRNQMLAIAVVPAVVMVAWWLWRHGIPPTGAEAMAASRRDRFLFKEPWLRVFLLRSFIYLPITALSAWAAVRVPRSRWWLVLLLGTGVIWGMYAVELPNELWVQMYEPPFTVQLGPVAVTFPQAAFTFGGIGNIVRVGGIDFFEYHQQPVLSTQVWRGLWALGVGLGILLLASMAGSLYDWLRSIRRGGGLSPKVAFYLLGAMTFVVSAALLGDVYDRYMFHFLPFVILYVVSGSVRWSRAAWAYSLAALMLIASFSLLAKADHIDHAAARWQAAQWVYARTAGLRAGYDWDNWVGSRNDAYQIADVPLDGYRVDRRFPYFSRLGGFTTRYVLAQSRLDVPPLPSP